MIHFLSTLSKLAKKTKPSDKPADTWPLSMTRRFHRICRKGDTSFFGQRQRGTRLFGISSQEQGSQDCSLESSQNLASAVNPTKKLEYIQYSGTLAYFHNSLIRSTVENLNVSS